MDRWKMLKKGGLIALGLASITSKKVDSLVSDLIRKGELNKKEGEALARKAVAEAWKEQKRLRCEAGKSASKVMSVARSEAKRLAKTAVKKPAAKLKKVKKKKR